MPLKEINYDETHFYRIVCRDLKVKDCYVGHTTDFYSRKCRHKSNCNNTNQEHYKLYVYEFIRENGGWENWDMILIKTEKCNNELEARARERYYIEMFKSSLNSMKRPYTSAEEKRQASLDYYNEHREEILENHRIYYQENREERIAYKHNYYDRERDNILERKREKRLENLEEERRKDREQYYKHKDKQLARDKEKVECECGAIISRGYIASHKKTSKHQQYLQSQTNPQE